MGTHRPVTAKTAGPSHLSTSHAPLLLLHINPASLERQPPAARAIRPRPPPGIAAQRGARTSPCPPGFLAHPTPHSRTLPTPSAIQESERAREGSRQAGNHGGRVAAAAVAQARGAVRAVRVAPARRAPQLPRLPPLALRRPLHPRALRRVVGGVPPPRRRRALRAPPRLPLFNAGPPLRRPRPGLAHPGRRAGLPLPRPAPRPRRRDAAPALPRQPPPRLGGGAVRVRRAARPILPRPRRRRAPLLRRRRRVPGLLVQRRRGRVPLPVVGRRRVRRRRRVLGVPHRRLLHGLRHLPDHLLPPDPPDGRLRARVRQVRRRRHRAPAPPTDQGAAQEDQPPLPQVHHLQPRPRLRQPVRRAALHHQAACHCQSRHRRRARADLAEPGGGAADVPPQRGQDHAQDAGHHERGRGVARRRHRPRLRQRPGEPGPGPPRHRRLPGAGERVPPGRRRGVQQRRRLRQPERGLHRRPQVRPVPGQQHLLPEAAGAGDVPGEQSGRHHGVRLRGGQGVAPRALHDRVLARHVAAREDGRDLMNRSPDRDSSWFLMQVFACLVYKLSTDSSAQGFFINEDCSSTCLSVPSATQQQCDRADGAVCLPFCFFILLHLRFLFFRAV